MVLVMCGRGGTGAEMLGALICGRARACAVQALSMACSCPPPPPQGLPLRILRPSVVGGSSLGHIMPGYIGNAGGEALACMVYELAALLLQQVSACLADAASFFR